MASGGREKEKKMREKLKNVPPGSSAIMEWRDVASHARVSLYFRPPLYCHLPVISSISMLCRDKKCQKFSKASGLCLNINKCELMAVRGSDLPSICNIHIKDIYVTKDQKTRELLNFDHIIERTQKKLNHWLMRDLLLRGRTWLSKPEGISRLTYSAMCWHVDQRTIKVIDKMFCNFLWRNKTHYVKKSTNSIEKGGLNFLDFNSLNNTFKINWIKYL